MQSLICLLILFVTPQKVSLYHTQIVYPKIYNENNTIEIDSLILELEASDFFGHVQINWVGENGEVLHEKPATTDCDYKTGVVKGLRLVSKVAVSVCDGGEINGYIQLEEQLYLIQPTNFNKAAHVIYEGNLTCCINTTNKTNLVLVETRKKRSTDYKWEFFNLTGDVIDIGGGDEHKQTNISNKTVQLLPKKDKNALLWKREEIDTELGYFYDVAWEKDPFTGKTRKKLLAHQKKFSSFSAQKR